MSHNELLDLLRDFQRNEITEHHIYKKLSQITKDEKNRVVLARISADEKKHYDILKKYSKTEVKPCRRRVFFYYWIARILGLTFGIKLMEKGESSAQDEYAALMGHIEEVGGIIDDEETHESELINLIQEERLDYAGSVVLGLNDALVELTGTLAGLSFALQNNRMIAMVGTITGIAASLSMAASEYLSKKTEGEGSPVKSAVYTGMAYILTVLALIAPYFFLEHYLVSLIITLAVALFIIFVFNYYISVARDLDFRRRFFEMATISITVAAFSFGVGFFIRSYFNIDV